MKKTILKILSITLAFCVLFGSFLSSSVAYAADDGLTGSGLRDPWNNPSCNTSDYAFYNDDFYETDIVKFNYKYVFDIDYSFVTQGYEDLYLTLIFNLDKAILGTSIFDFFYQFQLLSRQGGGLARLDDIQMTLYDFTNGYSVTVFPDYSFVPKYGTVSISAEELTFIYDIESIFVTLAFSFDDFQYPDKVLDSNQRLEFTYNTMNPPALTGLGPLSNSLTPDGPIGGGDPDDYEPEEDEPGWLYRVFTNALLFVLGGPIGVIVKAIQNFTEGSTLRGILRAVFGFDLGMIVDLISDIKNKQDENNAILDGIDGITGPSQDVEDVLDDFEESKPDIDNVAGDVEDNIDNLIDDNTTSDFIDCIKYICTLDLIKNGMILTVSFAFIGYVLFGRRE